jgi:hypothetical protein
MATRSFERGAPLMADMGYGADDLDRMVRAAGDAVLRDAAQGDPTERGTTPEDQADGFADRLIKRVTLFFDAPGYDDFIAAADALCATRGVDSYTDLVTVLVRDASA